MTKTNLAGMVEMAFAPEVAAPLPPDPELKPARPLVLQPIVLSGATVAFGEREQDLFFSRADLALAAVSHLVNETIRVERVDLSAGRSINTTLMPAALKCVDFSPDGKLLLTENEPVGLVGPDRIDVWNIEAAAPRHVIGFKPYDELEGGARGIVWGRFLPNDRIATVNSQGRLIVWDFKANAIWSITIEAQRRRAFLSPGRKYMAAIVGSSIPILDVQTGKTLKRLTGLPIGTEGGIRFGDIALCFRPDGKELAMAARDVLFAYDLSSSALTHEVYPPISEESIDFGHARLSYCSDGYILAPGDFVSGEQLLVGLDQQMVVWRYTPDKFHGLGPNGCFGGRYWYTAPPLSGSKSKPTLMSVLLPDNTVRAALAHMNFDNQMAVHPGATISLEMRELGLEPCCRSRGGSASPRATARSTTSPIT